jgi:phage FluMu protein Com
LVNLELLFHCRCQHCNFWWSIADKVPPNAMSCPHCGAVNSFELSDVSYTPYTGITPEEIKCIIDVLEIVIEELNVIDLETLLAERKQLLKDKGYKDEI